MRERRLNKTTRAVQEHQDEVDDPHVMGEPEQVEDTATGILEGKGVNDGAYHYQEDTSET